MNQPTLRILAIEDVEADLQLALRAIRKGGWEPDHLRVDRLDAIIAALEQDDWQVILIDFHVPGLDFEQALAVVTDRRPEVPVIMVSGSVGEERAVELMRLGAWDLVLKDNLSRLTGSLERCLREATERHVRRCFETELRLNEARLSLAVSAASMGVWEWDPGKRQSYWSPQCSVIVGRDLSRLDFEDFLGLIHAADQHRVRARIARSLGETTHFTTEFRIGADHPDQRWIACHGRTHFDANHHPLQVSGVLQDISTRKRIEAQLREASAVFSGSQDGMVITDRDGTILTVNPAFCALMGYNQPDLIGQNARSFLRQQGDSAASNNILVEVAEQGSWSGEITLERGDGSPVPLRCVITSVHDQSGQISGYVSSYSDVSQIKESDARIDFLSHHDPLTRLPNRLLLMSRLQSAIAEATAHNSIGAVLFLGLDRFKELNDGFGLSAGDSVLRNVAERCRSRLRESDLLARVGGDEFVVLLENLTMAEHAGRVAQDLINAMTEPVTTEFGTEIFIGISIGISLFPADGATAEILLRNADSALLLAKQSGRGGFRYSSEQMLSRAAERVALHSSLHRGLEREEFLLHYQPLVAIGEGGIVGVEALIRWAPPDRALVPPNRFIPMAEETGLIIPIGAWVMETACRQFRAWLDQGLALQSLAVNLSSVQFKHPELLTMIGEILRLSELPPHHLELEITESALMDGEETAAKLRAMKALGVRLSIDDFGTGYSSLAYLKRFPLDKLKIDKSFVDDIPAARTDTQIVATVISLARILHLDVLAEGVESEEQLAALRGLKCGYAQGYLFSRPVAAEQIPPLLAI